MSRGMSGCFFFESLHHETMVRLDEVEAVEHDTANIDKGLPITLHMKSGASHQVTMIEDVEALEARLEYEALRIGQGDE